MPEEPENFKITTKRIGQKCLNIATHLKLRHIVKKGLRDIDHLAGKLYRESEGL